MCARHWHKALSVCLVITFPFPIFNLFCPKSLCFGGGAETKHCWSSFGLSFPLGAFEESSHS